MGRRQVGQWDLCASRQCVVVVGQRCSRRVSTASRGQVLAASAVRASRQGTVLQEVLQAVLAAELLVEVVNRLHRDVAGRRQLGRLDDHIVPRLELELRHPAMSEQE